MKAAFFVTAMLVFGLSWPALAEPAPGLVRLKVTKKTKQDRQTIQQGPRGQHLDQAIDNAITYTIDVTNLGSKPLQDVRITWAVLLDVRNRNGTPPKGGASQVVDGEKTATIDGTKTFSFDTEPVQFTEWQRKTTDARVNSVTKQGSDIEGYAVEVFVDGKLLASDIQPADVKKRIDEAISTRTATKTR